MKTNLILSQFGFAGGSTIGSEHALHGKPGSKNNQDAFHWAHGRNCSFAVICDGCSKGAHSEVGAKMTSRILSKIVVELADALLDVNPQAFGDENYPFWERVEKLFLNDVLSITRMMGTSISETITDFWLCTVVGALITPYATHVVAVGDGAYDINGVFQKLEPGAGNSPTYYAYQITGTTLALEHVNLIHIRPQQVILTDQVNSLFLMSDGIEDLIASANLNMPGKANPIGPLSQFCDERFVLNPDNIRRRLALIGLETVRDLQIVASPLKDDTTILAIIRTSPPTQ